MDPASVLPYEVLARILSYLSPSPDYASLACVSKRWNDIVSSKIALNCYFTSIGALKWRTASAIKALNNGSELKWYPIFSGPGLEKLNSPIKETRLGAALAVCGHTLYLFGGGTGHSTAMNDLFTLNLLTLEWSRVYTFGNVSSTLVIPFMVLLNLFIARVSDI